MIHKMPAVGLVVPLIAGMMLGRWSDADVVVRLLSVSLAILSIVVWSNFCPLWKSLILSIILMAVGWKSMTEEVASTAFPVTSIQEIGKPQLLTATLLLKSDPVEKGERLRCEAKIMDALEDSLWKGRTIMAYIPKDGRADALRMGDCINARFMPRKPENFSDDFDYVSYLRNKGITATAYISGYKWELQSMEGKSVPLAWRLRIKGERFRRHLLNVYADHGIDGDRLALVSALSFGKKDLMDSEVRERFASAGVAHVLAVSGMHVGIVYGFVNAIVNLVWKCLALLSSPLLRLAGSSRRQRIYYILNRTAIVLRQLIVVAVLWCYAFITGLPASVVRAVTMFTLSAGAICLNKRSQTWNNLFFTAFLMLIFNPSYLMDIGFQLSFTAVMSILLFMPCLEGLLGIEGQEEMVSLFAGGMSDKSSGMPDKSCGMSDKTRGISDRSNNNIAEPLLYKVWHYMLSSMLISIAAQLGTAPLSVYYFHRFPQWFLLSNLVLVPTAVGVTWMAFVFQCLAAIPIVPEIIVDAVAFLLSESLGFFTNFAFFVESLPGAVKQGLLPSIVEILAVYMLVALVFYLFQKKAYLYTLENILRRIRNMKYGKYMKHR